MSYPPPPNPNGPYGAQQPPSGPPPVQSFGQPAQPGGYPPQTQGQPPYGQYGQPQYLQQPPSASTNGMAIASLVLGILWMWWLGSILALIFGYTAKKQIAQSGGLQQGGGLATAGIVLGWIGVASLCFFLLLGLAA